MNNFARIKQLHIEKKKSFILLLVLEAVLVLLGIAGLFGKDAVYDFGVESMRVNFGNMGDDGMAYIGGPENIKGNMVDFTDIALPAGTYRVELHYNTDTDMLNQCYVTDGVLGERLLQTNGTMLFAGLDRTDFDMWLYRKSANIIVHAAYEGVGSFAVSGLTIRQTNAMNRMILFGIVCFAILLDIVYIYREYDREYNIPVKNKTVTFLLGVTILIASLPLLQDYMISSGDLGYHLMRVEGIKDGILAGQFPIRISPEWQQGYGYASPIFYGETVLYIAGLLRLIGFTVTTSYRLFMFIVAAATVLIAYECFKKMFNEAYVGVFCSLLYSVSVYRVYKTYYCGSWGECFGIMFLPLAAYGFYRVFTQDINEKSYKRSFIPLTAAFTLLLQSHLLSCEMLGAFTIILCVIEFKKTFRMPTFIVLAKTVIYTLLLSAWFVVPFADYMLTGDFIIKHVSGRTIQSRGLFPAHLLFTFFVNGGTVFFETDGMADSAATGVGMALILPLFILLYMFFDKKTEGLTGNEKALSKIAAAFSVIAMIMSLSLFPWDKIQSLGGIAATLVSSIQFPNRFLTIANVGLTVTAGVIAKQLLVKGNKNGIIMYFGIMLVLVAAGNIYLLESGMEEADPVRVYNNEGMGTGYISGAEYLPNGADASLFMPHDPVCSGELYVDFYEKKSLGIEAYFENKGSVTENASLPLLYYKGYHAYAAGGDEELKCYAGKNFEVTVDIPKGFADTVAVRFVSPWYWRLGEAVSVVSLIVIIIVCTYTSRRDKIVVLEGEGA